MTPLPSLSYSESLSTTGYILSAALKPKMRADSQFVDPYFVLYLANTGSASKKVSIALIFSSEEESSFYSHWLYDIRPPLLSSVAPWPRSLQAAEWGIDSRTGGAVCTSGIINGQREAV